jgi:GT2 family glycosyltransferase
LAKDWTFEQINAYLETNYSGRSVEVSFVAFLCGVMKREVYEKIGLLDTAFAFGMWDDVDYSMSAQKLGYQTVLAIDTCIYHRGRSTFSLLEKTQKLDVGKLLSTNKEYLDRKWAPPGSQIRIREVQKKTSMRMI